MTSFKVVSLLLTYDNLIEKLNSTPLWNLILQKFFFSKVEFNSSYLSLIIPFINMVLPPSSKETIMMKQKHLNLEARILIETLLNERSSFKSIAKQLGKDCTTISKEIKSYVFLINPVPTVKHLMTANPLSFTSAPFRKSANVAPVILTALAGHAENVLLPVFLIKNISVQNFLNRLMSVTAVMSAVNALLKNVFTKYLLHRKNTNWSEANPVLVLLFLILN